MTTEAEVLAYCRKLATAGEYTDYATRESIIAILSAITSPMPSGDATCGLLDEVNDKLMAIQETARIAAMDAAEAARLDDEWAKDDLACRLDRLPDLDLQAPRTNVPAFFHQLG
jgi:uncharacterized membrane protein